MYYVQSKFQKIQIKTTCLIIENNQLYTSIFDLNIKLNNSKKTWTQFNWFRLTMSVKKFRKLI